MTARHVRIIPLATIFVALTPGVMVHAQVGDSFTGLVVGVTDGDTISVMRDGETVRIRLEGIDTPESNQAFGSRASVFTSSRVLNKRVTVHVRDVSRAPRFLWTAFCEQENELCPRENSTRLGPRREPGGRPERPQPCRRSSARGGGRRGGKYPSSSSGSRGSRSRASVDATG